MTPPTSIDGTDISSATIDGQEVQEITVDGQTVFTAGPPLEYIAYNGSPKSTYVHDIPGFGLNTQLKAEELTPNNDHDDAIDVEFSPDQNFLAFATKGDEGRTIYLIDVPEFELRNLGFVPDFRRGDISFSVDSNFIAATGGGDFPQIVVFRVPSMDVETRLFRSMGPPDTAAVDFSPDGSLLTYYNGGQLHAADVPSFSNERTVINGGIEADGSAYNPDGSLIAFTGFFEPVKIVSVPGFNTVTELAADEGGGNGPLSKDPAWSPDGSYLAVCVDAGLLIYETQSFTVDTLLTTADEDGAQGVNWDGQGNVLAFAAGRGRDTPIRVHEPEPPFSRITSFRIPGGEFANGELTFNV